jgi:Carboxypeptidase regulatory-like domain
VVKYLSSWFWLFCLASLLAVSPAGLLAQGETTSAIAGLVVDSGGGAIREATVTVISTDSGSRRSVRTDAAGRFNFPQLRPGPYSVKAEADGFDPQQNNSVFAGLGQKSSIEFTLKVASSRQDLTVNADNPLVAAENPNTATTLGSKSLEALPNAGGDLTYPIQFAPGALMNTAGSGNDFVGGTNGYGNVQFNGLSSLSNGYIVDGLETNDPLTNLNSGLSTNLVLGLNSISEMTVNTLSFAVDQGRYGASQVNYITKSGTNGLHGNLYQTWNGSKFNAANFFTNALPGNQKPRSVVNHFGGSLGGPIKKNKLFFFFDSEWVRIALPIISTTTVPTAAFQRYVLEQLPRGGSDAVTGSIYQPSPGSIPFYNKLFALYQNTSGTPLPVLGCPFNRDGSPSGGSPVNGDGCANRRTASLSSLSTEQVQTARVDYNIDQNNTAWFRFQNDNGLQAAYTDQINPIFNALSPQPLYSFASGFSHVFSPQLVNYFNPAFSWYESLFGPPDFGKTLDTFPIVLQGAGANAPFTTLGGLNDTWVQGRRALRYFINDNVAWSTGAHELRFGVNTRILRLNDYNFGQGVVPVVQYTTLPQFIYGVASNASRSFPLADNQPYNLFNLDLYAQDTWKVTHTLTWTFGLRATHNSNPANPHGALARLAGSFDAISHDVNQPLNNVIRTNVRNVFESVPLVILQPRTALAWQMNHKTVIRTGFGLFSDILPASVVDLVGVNPPYSRNFEGGLLGNVGGSVIAPGVPDSAVDATVRANEAFSSGFAKGELSCASPKANPSTCLPPIAFTAVPDGKLRAPYNMQWSFALERQVGTALNLRAQYVGTRSVNQPYQTQVNGYQTVCDGCFAPYPFAKPKDPRFGAVTQLSTGANSHYNGLQLTAEKRLSRGLQITANYTWSHCLDTVSNGGFLPFSAGGIISPLPGLLQRQYGPCDYDVRHNFTLQYLYQLPIKVSNRALGYAVNGWQVSGSVFRRSGIPFSVLSIPYSANGNGIVQGGGPQYASAVSGVPLYSKESVPGATQPGQRQWLNPDAFVSTVDPRTGQCVGGDNPINCQFGNLGRNALRGPLFTSGDLYITKWFNLSERFRLRIDGQFFNVLNHANFGLPVLGFAGVPGVRSTQTGFGALTYSTAPPTGLLGVGLGGDSSPRMIAFQGRLEF